MQLTSLITILTVAVAGVAASPAALWHPPVPTVNVQTNICPAHQTAYCCNADTTLGAGFVCHIAKTQCVGIVICCNNNNGVQSCGGITIIN